MKRKLTILLLLALFGCSGSLQAQSGNEVTLTIKLISAECGDFCYYDFKDVSTGEEIKLQWNTKWDQTKKAETFPDLDAESAKIMGFIVNCAQNSYYEGTNSSYCKEVLDKTFTVKAVKKTREEVVATGPETWEKTGKIEVYYELKHIRTKNKEVNNVESYAGEYFKEGTKYSCYIFKKNEKYYFSWTNSFNEAHLLEKSANKTSKYSLYSGWTESNGLGQTVDIGFAKENGNTIMYFKNFYRGQTSETKYIKNKNVPGEPKEYFNITFVNNEPSAGYKFWVEYDNRAGIFLDGGSEHTDINIKKGKYKVEYKFYTDGGLQYHRTGYLVVDRNKSIDFINDLINVVDGGEH